MIYSALSEFPILALASMGFYISFRFLRFPDLTVDAAFMFGMSAVGMTVGGGNSNELIALFLAPFFGFFVGVLTGVLYTSPGIQMNKFLAGMIVAFGSYSICFRMCGAANLSLFQFRENLLVNRIFADTNIYVEPLALSSVVILLWFILQRVLNTTFGLALRTTGHRQSIVTVGGFSSNAVLILGLGFANALVAIAGWLDATSNTNVSLKNFGLIVHVLAACLIGDFIRYLISAVFKNQRPWLFRHVGMLLISPLLGALAYCLIQSFVIRILSGELRATVTTDFQFIIAICIIAVITIGKRLNNFGETEEDLQL